MFPLAIVSQSRVNLFTDVLINQSSNVPINLYDYFVTKVGRPPEVDEKIKFIVTPNTVLVGDNSVTNSVDKDSCLYIKSNQFLPSNELHLENRGTILGKGGDGASVDTYIADSLYSGDNYEIIASYEYRVINIDRSTGGRVIVNESTNSLTITNLGTIAGGGGGGGSLNSTYASTDFKDSVYTQANGWCSDKTNAPGGGGVPYGKGGTEANRAVDYLEGRGSLVPQGLPTINQVIPLVKSEPAMIGRDLYSEYSVAVYGVYDTYATSYKIPLAKVPSNSHLVSFDVFYHVASKPGTSHYTRFENEINGVDSDRLYFIKNHVSPTLNASTAQDSMVTLTAPRYIGGSATLNLSGKGGYIVSSRLRVTTPYVPGYIASRGGDGGQLGRVGSPSTAVDDILMYKDNNPNNLSAGYTTRSRGYVRDTLNLPLYHEQKNGIDVSIRKSPGLPGKITSGLVSVTNVNAGVTIGRLDVLKLKNVLSSLGNLTSLRYFKVILDEQTPDLFDDTLSVVTWNALTNNAPVPVLSYTSIGGLNSKDLVTSMSISLANNVPPGSSWLLINEYGIHDSSSTGSGNLIISNVNQSKFSSPANMSLGDIPLILVTAPAADIGKIVTYINGLNLVKSDWDLRFSNR